LEGSGVGERIILKYILNKQEILGRTNSLLSFPYKLGIWYYKTGRTGQKPVTGSSEHNSESLSSMKGKEFLVT
jgi:hypothetical protein